MTTFGDAQRPTVALLAVAVLLPLVAWPGALNPVSGVQLTVVLVVATVGLAALAASAAGGARIRLPWHPTVALAGACAGVLVAHSLATSGWWAWWGAAGRGNGTLLYVACALLFVAMLEVVDAHRARAVATALCAVAGAVALHAVVQLAGLDPVGWDAPYDNPAVANLGNPNFVSALLGISVPLALAGALDARVSANLRRTAAALAGVAVAVSVATGSVQGPLVAVGGSAAVVAAVLADRAGRAARWGLPLLGAGGLLGVTGVAAGLAGWGPLQGLAGAAALGPRLLYWQAALSMLRAHPLGGVGLGGFEDYFRAHRPRASVLQYPETLIADAAHSVPLDLLAGGGLPVGLTYLAFVALVGVVGVRGLVAQRGRRRLWLGGFLGAWAAYQAQSLVSIDVPALAVWHWLLAGVVVALAADVRMIRVRLGNGGAPKAKRRRREQAALAVGAVVGLAGLWVALIPLRAEVAAAEGIARIEAGDVERGAARLDHAADLVPGNDRYPAERGDALAGQGALEAGLASHQEALAINPRRFPSLVTSARFAEELGDDALADEMWEGALAIERAHPEIVVEAAEYWQRRGEPQRGLELVERAQRLGVDTPELARLAEELSQDR